VLRRPSCFVDALALPVEKPLAIPMREPREQRRNMPGAPLCALGGCPPRPLRLRAFAGCPILTLRLLQRWGGIFPSHSLRARRGRPSRSEPALARTRRRLHALLCALRGCSPRPLRSRALARALTHRRLRNRTRRVPHPNVASFATLGGGFSPHSLVAQCSSPSSRSEPARRRRAVTSSSLRSLI
jgi:hypothetical protein